MTRLHKQPRSLSCLHGLASLLLTIAISLMMSPVHAYAEEDVDASSDEATIELTEMATTDVQSISFTPVNPITLQEGTDYTKSGNSYELERSFLKDGDTLVLNTSSGSETYVIANATWDPIFKNPNKWGDELAVWAFGTNDTTALTFPSMRRTRPSMFGT